MDNEHIEWIRAKYGEEAAAAYKSYLEAYEQSEKKYNEYQAFVPFYNVFSRKLNDMWNEINAELRAAQDLTSKRFAAYKLSKESHGQHQ